MAIVRTAANIVSTDAKALGWTVTFPMGIPFGTKLLLLKVHQNQANTGGMVGLGVASATLTGGGSWPLALIPGAEAGLPQEIGGVVRTEVWALENPSATGFSITVIFNSGGQTAGTRIVTIAAETWTGTNPSDPIGDVQAATGGNGTPAHVDVASSPTSVVTDAVTARTNHPLILGAGQVQLYAVQTGAGGSHLKAKSSDEAGASPSASMDWTGFGVLDAEWAIVGIQLKAFTAVVVTPSPVGVAFGVPAPTITLSPRLVTRRIMIDTADRQRVRMEVGE